MDIPTAKTVLDDLAKVIIGKTQDEAARGGPTTGLAELLSLVNLWKSNLELSGNRITIQLRGSKRRFEILDGRILRLEETEPG